MSRNQDINITDRMNIFEYSFIASVTIFLLYCLYSISSLFSAF